MRKKDIFILWIDRSTKIARTQSVTIHTHERIERELLITTFEEYSND